jgi:N-acetylmuramoyl-L-alanine amidase
MPAIKRIETLFAKMADINGLTPQDSVSMLQERRKALITYFVLILLALGNYQRVLLVFRTFLVNRLQRTLRTATLLLLATMVFSLHNKTALGASCNLTMRKVLVIVLDVGHVPREPGERCYRLMPERCPSGQPSARGVPEYDFNIELAQRIKQELVRADFISTHVLTTEVAGRSGLNQRADRANSINADIFFSIHHDGVDDKYLRPWMYNGEEHFFFDESKGFSLHISSPRNRRYKESIYVARILADNLIRSGLDFTRVHEPSNPVGARVPFLDPTRGIYQRDDNLIVLENTHMPSVLLEAGVIVNRNEELLVSSPAYREIIAAAVTETVTEFCNRLSESNASVNAPMDR